MSDDLTVLQRKMQEEINNTQAARKELEDRYGKDNVWDTKELQEHFVVEAFSAPFCGVTRKKDGAKGAVLFQHLPRFYFGFEELTSNKPKPV